MSMESSQDKKKRSVEGIFEILTLNRDIEPEKSVCIPNTANYFGEKSVKVSPALYM